MYNYLMRNGERKSGGYKNITQKIRKTIRR